MANDITMIYTVSDPQSILAPTPIQTRTRKDNGDSTVTEFVGDVTPPYAVMVLITVHTRCRRHQTGAEQRYVRVVWVRSCRGGKQ